MEIERVLHQSNCGTSFARTCFNVFNVLSGVGILSIPYALSQGGWISLTLLVTIALMCNYTGLLQKRCIDSDPSVRTYPDIGERAFGRKGRITITIFMCLELYLIAVEFLILAGDNLDKLFPNARFPIVSKQFGGKKIFIVLTALVILPTTWLRELGMMAYVSVCGNLAAVILFISVLCVGIVDGVGFHETGTLLKWTGLPTAVSLYTFCFCGHAVFPTLYSSMKNRNQYPKVLFVCYALSTICYGAFAITSYLMFGDNLYSQVTLNLPTGHVNSKIAIYTTLVYPITKYAIIVSPITTAIEDALPFHNNRFVNYITGTALLISSVFVALAIPHFGYVMAFIGSFLGISLSILFPCLCYVKINERYRNFGSELVVIVVMCIMGIFLAVLGTYTSVRQIVQLQVGV